MRYAAFKNHKIQKTCKEKFDDEKKYRCVFSCISLYINQG